MRRSRLAFVLAAAVAGATAVAGPVAAAPPTVVNPGLEQVQAGVPACFTQGGWGDGTTTWALTTAAHTGQVAQSITVAGRTSGDRKLMMTENATCAPAVLPGATYRVSVWYRSTTAAVSLTVFRHSAAGWTYWTDLSGAPAATAWSEAAVVTPAVPPGTDQVTFGLSLAGNGTLVTDDYALAQTGGGATTSELGYNVGLETAGSGGTPDGWALSGWGDAAITGKVVTAAHTGTAAYSLTLANRTQGDYKLLPAEARAPAVQPGATYRLSAWYQATTAANSVTLFAHTAGGWQYYADLLTLPAAAQWTRAIVDTPPVGAGIDALAWGVSLYGNGTLVTDDYSTIKTGDATPPAAGPATVGDWSVLTAPMPIRAVHATLLRTGKVLLIAGSGNSVDNFAAGSFAAAVWDPVANTYTTLTVPKDMFCAGHVTLADGRVLIQGGTKSYPTTAGGADYGGLRDSWIFDPASNQFTPAGLANEGHWYPTLTELGNGDVWMAGGLKEDTTGAVNSEMFSAAQGRWLPGNQVAQSWHFWGLYPHMFLLADGRLFYSGAHTFGNGTPGTGASLYDPGTGAVTDVPGLRQKDLRDQAASVLLPPAQDQKVLITGGGNINTNTPAIGLTDVVDLSRPTPAYTPGPDLPGDGKMYLNSTLLPDRTVLVTNGARLNRDASTNVSTAAVYSPAKGTWTSVAADPIGRNYHSSSVLLPDGRVAVFGSNPGDGSYELRVSVYKPTYLFGGQRPVLTGVPATMTYGQQATFGVALPGGSPVRWAQLTRPASVTHQTDANMRLVDLPVTVANGVATVAVTANHNLLPPGPYLLTVTDSTGVPSEASWVMIR